MSPAHSEPMMNGVFGGESIAPCLAIKSWKFNPLKETKETLLNIACNLDVAYPIEKSYIKPRNVSYDKSSKIVVTKTS